jgi:hypothetical protein
MNLVFKTPREEAHFSFGKTVNYSRKGFCFEADNIDIPSDKVIEFKLEIPKKGTFINGLGEIIWDKRLHNIDLIGIKLRDMYNESKWIILDFCYSKWIEKMHDRSGLLTVRNSFFTAAVNK